MSKQPYRFSRQVENLIANLRGIPEDHSIVERRRPKNLETALSNILDRYKIGIESLEDRIRDNWTTIVGEDNARYSHPSRIERDSILFISVSNPIIRQELQFNKSILLRKIHAIKNGKKIRQIVLKSG